MTLRLTEGVWTAPHSATDVHEYPHAVVSHGATCGAFTTTCQTGVQSEQVCA